jgi:hypothetical protein
MIDEAKTSSTKRRQKSPRQVLAVLKGDSDKQDKV